MWQGPPAFYRELLGWEFDGPGPGEYYVARTRDRDVAGVGAQPPGVPTAWNTYVSVASVERAVEAAGGAGGQVVMAPFDALPAGRVGVIADPSGAVLGLWEPHDRNGAQLVNAPRAWAMSMLQTAIRMRARRSTARCSAGRASRSDRPA